MKRNRAYWSRFPWRGLIFWTATLLVAGWHLYFAPEHGLIIGTITVGIVALSLKFASMENGKVLLDLAVWSYDGIGRFWVGVASFVDCFARRIVRNAKLRVLNTGRRRRWLEDLREEGLMNRLKKARSR